jgi:glycerate kinase
MARVVIAPDKFRGSATAFEAAAAMAEGAAAAGASVDRVPLSDGGEGFAAVLGGRRRPIRVHDPLGRVVEAGWYELDGGATAVIESAEAVGLALVGGPDRNDPVRASTAGLGELIAAAVQGASRRLLIGMGGSATTDGGWGALEVLEPHSRLSGVHIDGACAVRTRFLDAAAVFAPQKGASPAQVEFLGRRLERLAGVYRDRFGVDVTSLDGSGAAGGLAGGLAALGAELSGGFELVAERVELADRIEGADLVVTGEGHLDAQSFEGKTVGGVVALAAELQVPVLIVAGDADEGIAVEHHTLVATVGREAALSDPLESIARIVESLVRQKI